MKINTIFKDLEHVYQTYMSSFIVNEELNNIDKTINKNENKEINKNLNQDENSNQENNTKENTSSIKEQGFNLLFDKIIIQNNIIFKGKKIA